MVPVKLTSPTCNLQHSQEYCVTLFFTLLECLFFAKKFRFKLTFFLLSTVFTWFFISQCFVLQKHEKVLLECPPLMSTFPLLLTINLWVTYYKLLYSTQISNVFPPTLQASILVFREVHNQSALFYPLPPPPLPNSTLATLIPKWPSISAVGTPVPCPFSLPVGFINVNKYIKGTVSRDFRPLFGCHSHWQCRHRVGVV